MGLFESYGCTWRMTSTESHRQTQEFEVIFGLLFRESHLNTHTYKCIHQPSTLKSRSRNINLSPIYLISAKKHISILCGYHLKASKNFRNEEKVQAQ